MNTLTIGDRIQKIVDMGFIHTPNEDAYTNRDLVITDDQINMMPQADFIELVEKMKAYVAGNPDQYNRGLTIIDKSLDTFKNAGDILQKNKSRAEKAVAVGRKLLTELKANNNVMTSALDERMQKFLANCSNAKSGMNDDRKIFTQTMDLIKKAFTGEESKLDASTPGTEAYEIQQIRNNYAKQLHQEEQERQRLIRVQQEKDQEAIRLKAEGEKRLLKWVGEYTQAEKMRINTVFNGITLDTFNVKSEKLRVMDPVYPYAHLQQFAHGLYSPLFKVDEISSILDTTIGSKFQELAANYKMEISELRDFLVERLPSKKQELEAIKQQEEERKKEQEEQERIREETKTANANRQKELDAELKESQERERKANEERERIQNEQKQREQDGKDLLKKEGEDKERGQMQQIENNKELETTMSLFQTAADAATVSAPAPEVRQGYEIEVLNPAGYMQIFQLWFTEEGKSLSLDKIGGTKLDSMKTFCEKFAHKKGTKIDSQFLKYNDSFKAVNRKVK